MGVSTQGIITKGTTIERILSALEEKYEFVELRANQIDFMSISFKEKDKHRSLMVSFSNSCKEDNGISGVWLSLGCWGGSVEIISYLCETFGGYIDENDCDDKGFYPINIDLYSKGKEFTKIDEFRHKVIKELGYKNLEKTMILFDDYLKITKS